MIIIGLSLLPFVSNSTIPLQQWCHLFIRKNGVRASRSMAAFGRRMSSAPWTMWMMRIYWTESGLGQPKSRAPDFLVRGAILLAKIFFAEDPNVIDAVGGGIPNHIKTNGTIRMRHIISHAPDFVPGDFSMGVFEVFGEHLRSEYIQVFFETYPPDHCKDRQGRADSFWIPSQLKPSIFCVTR